MEPTEIGEYKVVRLLGRGGMGEVYLAEDPTLGRRVAIKLIAGLRDQPVARARFAVEARAIGRLKHPNVVTVHRAGDFDGRPYLVSEYVDGTPLDRLERPVPRDRALAIARQLARGLAAAHRENILHRDVKPANAILDRDGVVKLLDFGLAKLTAEASTVEERPVAPGARDVPARSEASTVTFHGEPAVPFGNPVELTAAGSVMGTPRYMSPEAWEGRRPTAASDVFSLGLVVWELLADRDLDRTKDGDVPPIRTAVPDLPEAIAAVVDRALRRDPGERHADAGAFLAALEAALSSPPAARPDRGALYAAGGAAILAGTTIAFVATRSSGEPASPPPPAIASAAAAPADAAAAAPVAKPRAITSLGGCADLPAFIDTATIAFDIAKGADVDLYTTTGTGAPAPFVTTPKLGEWRVATGRTPNEILYVRDVDGGAQELVAFDRASATHTRLAQASSAVAVGDRIYVIDDLHPGKIGVVAANATVAWIATMPAAKQPYVLGGAASAPRVAIVVADEGSLPSMCILDVASRHISCPATEALQNGRPAMTRDGRYVYYPARAGIRVLDLVAHTDKLAVPGVRASGGLALSPDERRLVYSDCRTWGSIVAAGRGEPEVLVGTGLVKSPGGGPGGAFAWIAARDGARGTRLMLRVPGQPDRELAAAEAELGRPAFDFDGAALAYSAGGIRSVAATGGPVTSWTDDAGDRNPTYVRGGGLAYTRLGAAGESAVYKQAGPREPPVRVAAGWTLDDVDRPGARGLVRAGARLAWLDLDTGTTTPIRVDPRIGAPIAARVSTDGSWLAVLAGGTFHRLDLATGTATTLYEVPPGQTAGPPTMLSDGRIAFRPEIWLGELYELEGDWASPAQRR